jgi:hypothetical protein
MSTIPSATNFPTSAQVPTNSILDQFNKQVYSGPFIDDPSAIAYLSNLAIGVWIIMRIVVSSPSTSYETLIYGPQ